MIPAPLLIIIQPPLPLNRSIYLAEYAACCPASAGAKSRSLISRVAAASSQQHDDDEDDGGGDGYSMPTTDQEAWTLDGWGDAPSVVSDQDLDWELLGHQSPGLV